MPYQGTLKSFKTRCANADLKISLYVRVHVKAIFKILCVLNLKNSWDVKKSLLFTKYTNFTGKQDKKLLQ